MHPVDAVFPVGQLVSVIVIVLICASVIAKNSEAAMAAGGGIAFGGGVCEALGGAVEVGLVNILVGVRNHEGANHSNY